MGFARSACDEEKSRARKMTILGQNWRYYYGRTCRPATFTILNSQCSIWESSQWKYNQQLRTFSITITQQIENCVNALRQCSYSWFFFTKILNSKFSMQVCRALNHVKKWLEYAQKWLTYKCNQLFPCCFHRPSSNRGWGNSSVSSSPPLLARPNKHWIKWTFAEKMLTFNYLRFCSKISAREGVL